MIIVELLSDHDPHYDSTQTGTTTEEQEGEEGPHNSYGFNNNDMIEDLKYRRPKLREWIDGIINEYYDDYEQGMR
jgi:hypothetical protein